MIGPDEYDCLVQRGFKPYSWNHQQMYHIAIEFMRGVTASVLEIGAGIGWGYEEMKEGGCLDRYFGVEESKKCFDYLKKTYPNAEFQHTKWPHHYIEGEGKFDFTICLEVIEHVDCDVHEFLRAIYHRTRKAFFLSTMDKEVNSHGTFTKDELYSMLYRAGFRRVVHIEHHMPHVMFICNP